MRCYLCLAHASLLLVTLLAGCEGSSDGSRSYWVGGSTVPTRDIEARIIATVFDGKETEIEAKMRDMTQLTDDVFIYFFGDSDTLRATAADSSAAPHFGDDLYDQVRDYADTRKILKTEYWYSGNDFTYTASFPGDYTGRTFIVSLTRHHGRLSAPASLATIPDAFAILDPVNDQSYRLAVDDITLTWAPAGLTDHMSVAIDLACEDNLRFSASFDIAGDPGVRTLTAAELAAAFADIKTPCNGPLRLLRSRPGSLDLEYGGGTISGRQERRVRIALAP